MALPTILYMGTPTFAVAPLRALYVKGYPIVAVVTVPDKPAGRGKRLRASPVKEFAEEKGLPLLQPPSLQDPTFTTKIQDLHPDLGIVVAFRKIPENIFTLPRLGTFNLHASLLPKYRGAAPINWAIMNGEETTGVSTFLLNNGLIDSGEILLQREFRIAKEMNAGTLHDGLMALGTELVCETVEALSCGSIVKKSQETGENYPTAPKIFRDTRRINWNNGVEKVHNQIRGLSPYPGAWCELRLITFQNSKISIQEVKILSSKVHTFFLDTQQQYCGHTQITNNGRTLLIACGDGWLSVEEIQPAGKRAMPIADYLRGLGEKCQLEFI